HADQGAFADTTASENPHALAASAGEQTIDRADAAAERLTNEFAFECMRRRAVQFAPSLRRKMWFSVKRRAERIDHAPKQTFTHAHMGARPPGHNPVAKAHVPWRFVCHSKHRRSAKPNNLPRVAASGRIHNFAHFARC